MSIRVFRLLSEAKNRQRQVKEEGEERKKKGAYRKFGIGADSDDLAQLVGDERCLFNYRNLILRLPCQIFPSVANAEQLVGNLKLKEQYRRQKNTLPSVMCCEIHTDGSSEGGECFRTCTQ